MLGDASNLEANLLEGELRRLAVHPHDVGHVDAALPGADIHHDPAAFGGAGFRPGRLRQYGGFRRADVESGFALLGAESGGSESCRGFVERQSQDVGNAGLLRLATDWKDDEQDEYVGEHESAHSDGDVRGESSGE